MKRTLFVAAIVLGFATAASAATLSISSDKASYNIGETITLTLTGTSTSSEVAKQVFAAVGYSAALTETVSSSQVAHTTSFGMNTWTQGTLNVLDGEAELLNQIAGLSPQANGLGVSTATATLVAEAAGIVTVSFLDASTFGGDVDYFDVQLASQTTGTSFTIVPEPTVATLIGLGLVGLAVGGRRRSS